MFGGTVLFVIQIMQATEQATGLPICLVDEVITCLGGLYISLSSQHVVQTTSVMQAIWLVNCRFILNIYLDSSFQL